MKASEEHIDLFDRYFNGELSTRERLHLEETLKKDPELNAEFQEYRDMVLGIEAVTPKILKKELAAIDQQIPSNELKPYKPQVSGKNRSKKERNWNIMMWFMIIGSGVLLVAFLIAIFNLPDLEERFRTDKKGKVERVITEEKAEPNCTMIACLPPTMYPNYQLGGDTVPKTATEPYFVCMYDTEGQPSIEMVKSSSGDTINLRNLPCDHVQLYFTPYGESGVLLECDSVMYRVDENRYELFQPQDSVATPLSDNEMEELEDILDAGQESASTDVIEKIDLNNNEPQIMTDAGITREADFGQDFYQWLSQHIRYPQSAKTKNVSGLVKVGFTVDKNGLVRHPVIEQSLDPDYDAEVLRCIQLMPKWTPAMVDGTPVDQKISRQVKFNPPTDL